MKPKTLAILAFAAAAVAVIAAVVSRKDRPVAPPEAPAEARLFPDLGPKLGAVATVSIQHGDKDLSIRRAGEAWQLAEKGGYPVKADQVATVLRGLSELLQAEKRTAKPENYPKLNVQDPDGKPVEPGAQAPTLLTLKDDKDAVLAAAIIGTTEYGSKPAVNIRKQGDSQTWLASGTLDVPSDPIRWMETKILEIPESRIKGVTVTQPDGPTLVLSRNSAQETNFAVADIPAGDELKSPGAGNAVAQALGYMAFEDVAPASTIDFSGQSGGKPGAYCEFRTFEGLVLAIQLTEVSGKTWARFTANAEDPGAPATPATPEQPDPAAAQREAVQKEVADLNAKLGPWAFAIPDFKKTVLSTKLVDLLKSTVPAPPPSMEGTFPLTPPPTPGPTGG